ncbi:MAG: bifunctional glutamate N-acetyltransferase/amino-acid acetyltransferase ArgJ [bacterium]|nr:bifunctional glutamate N-acetyltransferase/amino-acid acetyltransferase ArgJ [bacterium]
MKLPRRAHRVRVPGFRFAGVRAGLKTRGRDVALIACERPVTAAGVLTTNRAPAAPVVLTRARLATGRAAAVLVNAGNANACTGRAGQRTAESSTALVAELLAVPPASVLVCSTGRIGVPVPDDLLQGGVRAAARALRPDGFGDAAEAICTTDAFPKTAVRRLRLGGKPVTIAVLGKGAGMISPNMATLLVFACTDARLSPAVARRALAAGVDGSFNRITVDGDMSTNDSVLLLASGAAGNAAVRAGSPDHRRFEQALTAALAEVARLVVLDGEGARKCVQVTVEGARDDDAAQCAARGVAESMLCKAAFAGADPNWGRFVCAAGATGVTLDAGRVDVVIGGVPVARAGRPIPGALRRAKARMQQREFTVLLRLRQGTGRGWMWTSDLTVEYVHFNAAYTT